MTGGSLGLRTGSYGSLQQGQNGVLQTQNSFIVRKSSRMSLSGSREKERFLPLIYRYFGRRKVGMLILAVFALLAFLTGFITVHKEEASESSGPYIAQTIQNKKNSEVETVTVCGDVNSERPPIPNPFSPAIVTVSSSSLEHPCRHFSVPPPPPGDRRRIGPRPCPVCYLPVDQALARMPSSPSASPVLQHLNYVREEPHGGSDFGGFPSLKQKNDSFNIKESMTVHCGV